MKNVITSAGLIALGAVGVQTAHAQLTAGTEKPWSISGTLRGFYDDNYNTAPDGPSRVSSFGFELRPSAAFNFHNGPTTVNASYLYSYKYYEARPNNKADQSHDVELFLNHNFNERYAVDVSDSFVIAQEPELLDRTLSFPLRSNGNNIRNTAAINFHAELTKLLGIVVGYANTFYDYEENAGNTPTPTFPSQSALLDRMEHLVTFNTRWHIWTQTTGILGYQFGAVGYTSSESIFAPLLAPNFPFVASDTRNNYSHYVYVGAEHTFRSDFSASGRVGIQYLDYYNSPAGNSQTSLSPYVDLSMNYTYMDGGTFVLGFHYAHNQSDQAAASQLTPSGPITSVSLDQASATLYGSLTQRLTPISPHLVASLTGQYQNSTFNGGPANNAVDNFYLVGFNLAYEFNHYLSAELGYNYDLLSSQLAGRGYDRNRVYVGVTASY
ncbi:MAG: hypothetical protein JWR26_4833 [Pedosphaera sp.]|nr:hypothetical protein [Pedosphaera sp.]